MKKMIEIKDIFDKQYIPTELDFNNKYTCTGLSGLLEKSDGTKIDLSNTELTKIRFTMNSSGVITIDNPENESISKVNIIIEYEEK